MPLEKPQKPQPSAPQTMTVAGETVKIFDVPLERPMARWIDRDDIAALISRATGSDKD